MSFPEALAAAAAAASARLEAEIATLPESRVRNAMAHALVGGKGLRAFLVLESARLHGVSGADALTAAAAIEAMHAYSLVHDDLPAMDDDDLRRGRPTVHIAFDEATAILAGDALQSLAFELAAGLPHAPLMVKTLAQAAGAGGMVLGQTLDIAAETAPRPLDLEQIGTLQAHKTGALFIWSASAGARMAGSDPAALIAYAEALGSAFQIADDLLDTEGSAEATGKRVGKDAGAGKATTVSILGAEAARARAGALVELAIAALSGYGEEAAPLRAAARFTIARDR